MHGAPPIPAPWCDVPPWEKGRVYASVKEELAACLARLRIPGEYEESAAYKRMRDLLGRDLTWTFLTTIWDVKWLLSGDDYWSPGPYNFEFVSKRTTSYGLALRNGERLTEAEWDDLSFGALEVGVSLRECRAIARGDLSWFRG